MANQALASQLATTSVPGDLAASDKTKLDALAASQAATVGLLTVDVILETPSSPAYASSVALDVGAKNDFTPGALTGNITFTFTNAAAGRQGTIVVIQDGTGGRTVTFTMPATFTLRTPLGSDLVAQTAANSQTLYTYNMYASAGTNYLAITKVHLV